MKANISLIVIVWVAVAGSWAVVAAAGAVLSNITVKELRRTPTHNRLEKLIVEGDVSNEASRRNALAVFSLTGLGVMSVVVDPNVRTVPNLACVAGAAIGAFILSKNTLVVRRSIGQKIQLAKEMLELGEVHQ